MLLTPKSTKPLETQVTANEATPQTDYSKNHQQEQQVSKNTINSYNNSNLSNFYNSLGASGQMPPGIYKNLKL
jgi:hypothetical protein